MDLRESVDLELKAELPKDICKEIVAFANTQGGRILIGVSDLGEVVGVADPDETMLKVSNLIIDGIRPEIRAFVTVNLIELDGRPVVEIRVEEGDRKPYCLAQKGFTPKGVYMRTGTSSAPVNHDMIRSMIKQSDGDVYENRRCMRQDLTFETATRAFLQNDVELDRSGMRTLGIVDPDGYWTNLGLLLSDQCDFSIKCAVFREGMQFQSREEFGGSVFEQIEGALRFLEIANSLRSRIEGYVREDSRDYPEQAVREALLNAIVHRDYDYPASVVVKVFSDRMEFVSLGGLAKGVTREDILNGASVSRNPRLAAVFYRLKLIESYGTGIQMIEELYRDCPLAPDFKTAPASFVTVLPNMNECSREGLFGGGKTDDSPNMYALGGGQTLRAHGSGANEAFDDQAEGNRERYEYAVIEMVKQRGEVRRVDVERQLSIGRDASLSLLNELVKEGKLIRTGSTRATRYRCA